MTSGMKIQKFDAENVTPPQFIKKSRKRLGMFIFVGISEIDKITVMGKNMLRGISEFSAIVFEVGNTHFRKRRSCPLTLIFSKKSKGFSLNRRSIEGGVFNTAAAADMGADKFPEDLLC